MNQREEVLTEVPQKTKVDLISELLSKMTLAEKIGQMSQFAGQNGIPWNLREDIKQGKVGSVLNEVNPENLREIQRIAVEESRLGIPIIVGRDVIHGFQTMMPIPLGQSASWNEELVKEGARVSAVEAASMGIHWTFAPMLDVTRDPRWGRVAESFGEDPYLGERMGVSMVKGFQGNDLSHPQSIASCAKHFAGYGYSEAGRDYAYVNISENEMRNVVLPPFKAAKEAGAATFMTAFSDVNGVPATANQFLVKRVLRDEWNFEGFVVSDWDSVIQLVTHGFSEDEKHAAMHAVRAGVDMEMASHSYLHHLEELVAEGRIPEEKIDQSVIRILGLKYDLGLFENPYVDPRQYPKNGNSNHMAVAKEAAVESCVLLKNDYKTLPLHKEKVKNVAVIGPLADDAYEQMGTWTFDGKPEWCKTPLESIHNYLGSEVNIMYARGLENSRSNNRDGFAKALEIAQKAETVILFMGEEAILSGEAHCRADIDLPGVQNELLEQISKLGKQTILVVMAGRPLTLPKTQEYVNSLLYAWHPGTMGGPAIVDLLFGERSPSGKLPISFPKMVGQIPIYYNQRNSGKPASYDSFVFIDDIPHRAFQTSVGNTAFHMDAGFEPLYPFGFGMSYAEFHYHNIQLSSETIKIGNSITISVDVTNVSQFHAKEVCQLYIRDLFGSVTRPVRELKGFEKVFLEPGETKSVVFELHSDELAFFDKKMDKITEPGDFNIWVGSDSNASLGASFKVIDNQSTN